MPGETLAALPADYQRKWGDSAGCGKTGNGSRP